MFIDEDFQISKERLVLIAQNAMEYIQESVGKSEAKNIFKDVLGLDKKDLKVLGH